MDKESATITFNSGRVSSMGSSNLEFKGVPIKEILGDMWDKYKKFKLVLNTHAGNNNSGYFNKQHSIRISGLPFINTTDYKIYNNIEKSLVYTLPTFPNSMINLNQLPANNGGTFLKPSNHNVDITINFIDRNFLLVNANIGFNIFTFSIYGIEE
jgi:hypothetical protein